MDVPEALSYAAGLHALVTFLVQAVEEANGFQVAHVASCLTSKAPCTLTVAGSLFGGVEQCPFYHERQIASHCGLHVVNVFLDHAVYTTQSFRVVVNEAMQHSQGGGVVQRADLVSASGDYSQDILQLALVRHRGTDGSFPLQPVEGDTALQKIANKNLVVVVIQYDANHALMKPAHWLRFRIDEDGAWWNMDSLLHAPVRVTTSEALEKVQCYLHTMKGHLFRAPFVLPRPYVPPSIPPSPISQPHSPRSGSQSSQPSYTCHPSEPSQTRDHSQPSQISLLGVSVSKKCKRENEASQRKEKTQIIPDDAVWREIFGPRIAPCGMEYDECMLRMLALPNACKRACIDNGFWRRAMWWHRTTVDSCDPKGHPVLFCVVLKDRRSWEGISHARTPKKLHI